MLNTLGSSLLCPAVHVEGVGRLGLPLSKEQAVTLKSVAEQAPREGPEDSSRHSSQICMLGGVAALAKQKTACEQLPVG